MYKFGEDISYAYELLKADDFENLQLFQCGNRQLDNHIKNAVIKNGAIVDEDGIYFKFIDLFTNKIIAVMSLATSGIVKKIDPYLHVLPALKVDVLAVDVNYQKLHYNQESLDSSDPSDHYYFSDEIISTAVKLGYEIIEKYAMIDYVVVYADKKAYRYYQRNGFHDFENFMVKENNMEIRENIPMYLEY